MIAISARMSEPMKLRTPTSTQAAMIRPKSLIFLATSCGFLKMPEPITVPMTIAVAIQNPRTRGNLAGAAGVGLSMRASLGCSSLSAAQSIVNRQPFVAFRRSLDDDAIEPGVIELMQSGV